jgi:hypothetical protein
MATTKTPAKAKAATAAKAATKPVRGATRGQQRDDATIRSRRVFAVGQCHHRNAAGEPDCKKQIVAKRANLCPAHEAEWQKAARVRYAARRAANATQANAAKGPMLEQQLKTSVTAFATPQLAEKAKAKRDAQKAARVAK